MSEPSTSTKSLTSYLRGDVVPPNLNDTPPEKYQRVINAIETALALASIEHNRLELDEEYARLFRQLRRFPDGSDRNPLHSDLQEFLKSLLLGTELSLAELTAVLKRLEKSAKTFRSGAISRNYAEHVLIPASQSPTARAMSGDMPLEAELQPEA